MKRAGQSRCEVKFAPCDDAIALSPFDDSFSSGGGIDLVSGLSGNDRLLAEAGDDYVDGGSGSDVLMGGFGKDILAGGHDRDKLFGGAGSDILIGGSGNDVLTGGGQADFFTANRLGGADVITDFVNGTDRIVFTPGIETSFSDLVIRQDGDDTILTYSGGKLRIIGVDASSLTRADVLFEVDAAFAVQESRFETAWDYVSLTVF